MAVYVQSAQPSPISLGDFWVNPATRAVKVVSSTDPKVVFADVFSGDAKPPVASVAGSIPAGGTGAAAGAWDTAGNRDTAITTITEIKAQLNALLVTLRSIGLIQS